MAREYLPKLAIAILVVSVALILLSAQPTQVSALRNPQNSTDYHSWHHYWWGGGYYGGGYYWSYPYYYYYYPYYYPYYYSSNYCPSNSYYSSYPYYYGYPYYYSSSYCAPSSYTLTVATDPSSLGTVTGGGSYNSGSSASFSVTQPTVQVSSNTRYVFDHWSGGYTGSGTSGSVTVNNAMTVTAVYQLQYYLTVNSQPQNAPTPQGSGWYNAGNTVTLQNAGQTIGDSTSRLVFQGWSIDGQAPQNGSSLNIVVDGPHTATAMYGQQYYLNVQTDQGVTSGSGWYDAGSTAQISVSTPVSTQYGVTIIFNGWQGDTQSTSQSTTVVVNGPMNVIATWRTDSTVLYLTIGAIIIAAVLIIAGIFAFMAKGRGGTQAPPQPFQPTTPPIQPSTQASNTQPNQPAAEHRTRHYRKKTPPTETENTQPTPAPS